MKEGLHTEPVAIDARMPCILVKRSLVSVTRLGGIGLLAGTISPSRFPAARALKRPLFVIGLSSQPVQSTSWTRTPGISGLLAARESWARLRAGVDSLVVS